MRGRMVLLLLLASFAAGAGNRDPTMPGRVDVDPEILRKLALEEEATAEPEEEQPLLLTAIFSSMTRKVAVINGVLVKEGDIVQGKNIIKITENSVVFDDDGDETVRTLPLMTIKEEAL
jgi:hypothetical protein